MPTRARLLTILALPALAAVVAAQCPDPPMPAGGFPLTVTTDQLVTFTDAYRTRADVRVPTAPPGPCGWPLLVAVHGFPGDKSGPIALQAADFAARGYCVVTYDVRGQGSAVALNPGRGTTLMALAEWIDLFEIVEWTAAAAPGRVDLGRIGVFGISQGGAHAWAAAAWSGRTPPPNPRRSAPFPVVRAVAPGVMVPSHTDAGTLDGTAFVDSWAGLAFLASSPNVALDPAFQTTMRNYLLADDPAGMRAWMRADPGRDFQALLPTSTTAVLVTMAWLDETMNANASLQALAGMTAAAGRRAMLTTGNHGTPSNAYEGARTDAVRRAWFERFLKHGAEPTELGPPVTSACLPATRTEYLTSTTLWRHRADEQFPPATAAPSPYYLRQGGTLSTTAPTTNEPPEAIQHTVPPGYDLAAWRADGAGQNVALALARLPLSRVQYTTPPFATATELAGIPRLLLEVTPLQPRFLLAARLEVVPATGTPQVLAVGGLGVRQPGSPAPMTVTIELGATACVVPAGARLRLSVQNHYLVMAAAAEAFRYLPSFASSRVELEHRPGAASRLELPMRAEPGLDVTTAATQIALAAPAPTDFTVRSSPARAGGIYWLLGSLLGQGPPVVWPGGERLYLQSDALTASLLGAVGSPLLPGFVGVLDPTGAGTATLQLGPLAPLPADLLGWRVHLAPITLHAGTVRTGAPLELEFR
jgi:predicted acyl esterase